MISFSRASALGFFLAVLAGCGGDDEGAPESTSVPEGCNPLAYEWDCLLPFPSDHFTEKDTSLPSGRRVVIGQAARFKSKDGAVFDMTTLHAADGFSPGSQILALFPVKIADAALVFHTEDVQKSTTNESPTLLVDAESGERLLHFAEVDPRAKDETRQGLVIRPLVRLKDGHRYIVAIRDLEDSTGAPLDPPEGFARIVEKRAGGDRVLGPLAKRYESEIFPVLEKAGVVRDELLLAWDFTTRSEENATRDLVAVRDHMLKHLAEKPLGFSIAGVEDNPSPQVFRRIEAVMKLPLYLEKDEPLARLSRDAAGNVTPNGEVDVPFTVIIPSSVGTRAAGTPPARLMQYGHGFFGTRAEADGVPTELGDEKGFVVVATNWVGMADEDQIKVGDTLLNDTANTGVFTDRLHQAMANQIALGALAKGALATAPELQVPAGPAYDPSALYFYGNGNGYILGATYVALAPDVERAVFGVGGVNYSYIMFRAQPFAIFLFLLGDVLPDALDQQKFGHQAQLSFDRIDPLTYAPRLLTNTLAGSPTERRVLLQIGIGDAAVSPLAAHLHARTLGIPYLEPKPRVIGGLEAKAAPFDGSALQEFDFNLDPEPGIEAKPPAEDSPVHEGVRRLAASREQLSRFLKPGGKIEATCSGVCDPE